MTQYQEQNSFVTFLHQLNSMLVLHLMKFWNTDSVEAYSYSAKLLSDDPLILISSFQRIKIPKEFGNSDRDINEYGSQD